MYIYLLINCIILNLIDRESNMNNKMFLLNVYIVAAASIG